MILWRVILWGGSQNKSLEQEKEIVAQLKTQNAHIIDFLKANENKPRDLNLEDEQHAHRTPDGTLFKNECINLIETDDNMDQLFCITKYKDDIICFHIFEDLYKFKSIEKGIDHKIEFIEEIDGRVNQTIIRTLIKSSRTKDGLVIKNISFPATRELMIALTTDVGIDFDKNALDQYKIILRVCLKP